MHRSASLQLFLVVWIFLRSLGVIRVLSEGHKIYFQDWCLMSFYPTFLCLTYFNSELWPYYQKDVNQISLTHITLQKLSFTNVWVAFKFCSLWIFPWVSWHSCSIWDKLVFLNWFRQFLCEELSSFNPKRFYYSYAWSCSLFEGRTYFCTGLISRKLCIFLLTFLTGFTSLSVLLLFPLSITFLVFMFSCRFFFI